MLGRLIPKDQEFFSLFNELSNHLLTSARLLRELFDDSTRLNEKIRAIKEVEHKADQLTHEVNKRIDASFVTPIDREDIHELATRLDDVIDLIDGTARRAETFHLGPVRAPARELCALIVEATEHLQRAVSGIKRPLIRQPTQLLPMSVWTA